MKKLSSNYYRRLLESQHVLGFIPSFLLGVFMLSFNLLYKVVIGVVNKLIYDY